MLADGVTDDGQRLIAKADIVYKGEIKVDRRFIIQKHTPELAGDNQYR